ncbi:MAG: hypothetical protein NVSMB27_13410 [Ktedonobacteraceae bacterium]
MLSSLAIRLFQKREVSYERINHHHFTFKTLLSGWERALLALPALAALVLGFPLVFLPGLFAAVTQFPADDAYIYQLAGWCFR